MPINLEEKVFAQTAEIATLIAGQSNIQGEVKEIKKDLGNFFSTYAQDQIRNETERKANFADLHKTLKDTMDLKVNVATFQDYQLEQKTLWNAVHIRLLPLEVRLVEENTLITKSLGVKELWGRSTKFVKTVVGIASLVTGLDFLLNAKSVINFLLNLKK